MDHKLAQPKGELDVVGLNPSQVIPNKDFKKWHLLPLVRCSTLKERSRGINKGSYQWSNLPAVALLSADL